MAFKLEPTRNAADATQRSLTLSPSLFNDPDRDELRRVADHWACFAGDESTRADWYADAALLSDANPEFEPDAKRAAAARARKVRRQMARARRDCMNDPEAQSYDDLAGEIG